MIQNPQVFSATKMIKTPCPNCLTVSWETMTHIANPSEDTVREYCDQCAPEEVYRLIEKEKEAMNRLLYNTEDMKYWRIKGIYMGRQFIILKEAHAI